MKRVTRFLTGVTLITISACGGGGGGGGGGPETNGEDAVVINGTPICDDFGGLAEFGCRIVPPGAPPDIGLSLKNRTESILVDIGSKQHIELIDSDNIQETIAAAMFVTNNAGLNATVSVTFELTDENGDRVAGVDAIDATPFLFPPGFSGLVAFTASLEVRTLSPVSYHGVRIIASTTAGPVVFGNFSQVNIFEVDGASNVQP